MELINQIYSLMQAIFPFLKWTQKVLDSMQTKNELIYCTNLKLK